MIMAFMDNFPKFNRSSLCAFLQYRYWQRNKSNSFDLLLFSASVYKIAQNVARK